MKNIFDKLKNVMMIISIFIVLFVLSCLSVYGLKKGVRFIESILESLDSSSISIEQSSLESNVDTQEIINRYWSSVVDKFPEAANNEYIKGHVILFPRTGVVVYYSLIDYTKGAVSGNYYCTYQVEYDLVSQKVISIKEIKR